MDEFEFKLVGDEKAPFSGYASTFDKTKVTSQSMIRGSLNVYKKRSGNIANRPGLKRRGAVDATEAGVLSSYEFRSSTGGGRTIPLRVANNKLQFESDLVTSGTFVWYDLLEKTTLLSPAREKTRFSFAPWFENIEHKDMLIMARGDTNILHWSGGFAVAGTVTPAAAGGIEFYDEVNAGTGYEVGDLIYVGGSGTGGILEVTEVGVSGDVVQANTLIDPGTGYSVATVPTTSDGAGTGLTIDIISVKAYGKILKRDTDTTWIEDGFASGIMDTYQDRKFFIVDGVQYTYTAGMDTDTLLGVFPDPTPIASGSMLVQPVFVEANKPFSTVRADFISTLDNQLFVASTSIQVVFISSFYTTVARGLGFVDFNSGAAGNHVAGTPEQVFLDELPTAMIPRNGKMYISAGTSGWYQVTPNFPVPQSYTDSSSVVHYITTKVERLSGTGLTSCLAFEFIDTFENNIVYLGKDHQLHSLGIFSNIEDVHFPVLSIPVYEELKEENFTGGHLKAIEDTIYITAPASGRHWMYQIRNSIDQNNSVFSERIWHPPQAAGLSRFAEVDGLVLGHSASNPQFYQIWDTNQWFDDGPTEDQSYVSILRMAYRNHGQREGLISFNMVFYEGYASEGTLLYGNIYYDYQGATKVGSVVINSVAEPTEFFQGSAMPALGSIALGQNPLGTSLIPEANDQELLPKFRSICDTPKQDCFEYSLEVYSESVGDRWEIVCLGTNATVAPFVATNIRK